MNNVRTSKKRDAMLALLRSTHCHPSADWVYRELKAQYPDLSLGTVYRNLNHLCERGLIQRVGAVDGQDAAGVQYGFQAEGCEFIVRGTCRDCVDGQAEAKP